MSSIGLLRSPRLQPLALPSAPEVRELTSFLGSTSELEILPEPHLGLANRHMIELISTDFLSNSLKYP